MTFLFTDIEGSTHLAEAMPARWPMLLERHRAIIRGALTVNGGTEVQTEGDGFFAVFSSAPAGVAAAVDAQRALAAEPWPPEAPIRVRMGLHSGEAVIDSDGSYVGHDVHRAARLGSAGHGGQVLLSDSTSALVARSLPAGTALQDLGEHRLKDLRPERISQVLIDGLPSDFASLRSLDARPNNLPMQVTSFIGREHELASAADLLAGTRLLTLSGPGGTGKTRLALQLAADVSDQFTDGVWFVALEPLRDGQLVLPTVAHTLGIVPRPGQPAIDAIAGSVADKRVLLVLDNMEQVIEAAGDVATLLRACARTTVIVTSRAVLRITGEQEYVVPGLPTPPDTAALSRLELDRLPAGQRNVDPATLDQYEAVRLFIARAQAAWPAFAVTAQNAPAIAGITARLQGMPLAIELAAARIKLLSGEQILGRLERQLGFLTSSARDLPDRQRTLRGAIGWSYELLDEPHRRLLGRLSIFRGGWDLDEAESVAAAPDDTAPIDVFDGLAHLVDQSLVRRTDDDSVRFSMLETIREFALEMLESSGDAERTASVHARVFLALAERAAPGLQGTDQRRWLDHLERDHDNLRKALAWFGGRPDASEAVRLTFALWRFWQKRGYLEEARRLIDQLTERTRDLPPDVLARFAEAAGGIAYWQGDLPEAIRWYDLGLSIRRDLAAAGEPEALRGLADALYNRGYTGVAEVMGGDRTDRRPDPVSEQMMEAALAIYREIGDAVGEANVLWGLGGYLLFVGEMAAAEDRMRQSLELHRSSGQPTMEAWTLHMLGLTMLMQGRTAEAGVPAADALRHFDAVGDVSGITMALDALAVVAAGDDDRPRAGRLWGAARQLQESSGTGLADWDAALYSDMTINVRNAIGPEELDHLAAEGASLSIGEVVAYALREADPFGGGGSTISPLGT